jgi:hypothetical protein
MELGPSSIDSKIKPVYNDFSWNNSIDVLASSNSVTDGAAAVGVADIDGLVQEDHRGIVMSATPTAAAPSVTLLLLARTSMLS